MTSKSIKFMAIVLGLIGTSLIQLFFEGGALFMSLILIFLLVVTFHTIAAFMQPDPNRNATLRKIQTSGTIALALGAGGTLIGLISALEFISQAGSAAPSIMAGGLRVSLLSSVFGLLTFALSRLAVLVILTLKPEQPDHAAL